MATLTPDSIAAPIKVMILLGTRPEAIKLAPVVLMLRARPDRFRCILVSTGQHRTMLEQTLAAFGLGRDAVDVSLDIMVPDQTLSGLTARAIMGMDETLQYVQPDMIIVQGDTTTAFVGALAAYYHKIPVGHVEAGLRTHNLYAPFPEEFNRRGIGVMAALHFAATGMAAANLVQEGKDPATIFVTGNTVVDALRHYSSTEAAKSAESSAYVSAIKDAQAHRCPSVRADGVDRCRLILLTAHRRENHGQPLRDIMSAVHQILEKHPDVMVAYPVHLNPHVREALRASVPDTVYDQLAMTGTTTFREHVSDPSDNEQREGEASRLILVPPLDYPDLVEVMRLSNVIMTDSGGIQEEGAVLGKPILILRNTTERPEGVHAGVATLVGTEPKRIMAELDRLLQHPDIERDMVGRTRELYGDGNAAQRIVELIEWHATKPRDESPPPPIAPYVHTAAPGSTIDLVVVLTVWKRDTLEAYLNMLSKQSLFSTNPSVRAHIVVFQNGCHLNVTSILDRWRTNASVCWGEIASRVELTHVHSPVATGYYGRFLAPFSVTVQPGAYFVICDDDVVFGTRYLENMVRVADGGALAVRVGRFLGNMTDDHGYVEHMGTTPRGWSQGVQVTHDVDIEYDFGGQIWVGRFEWLRLLWQHPPPVWITSEDFWISAVLRVFGDIPTKRPRCPVTDMEECACSMQTALEHQPVEVGASSGGEFSLRENAMGEIARAYAYTPLGASAMEREAQAYTYHEIGAGPFHVPAGSWAEKCLFFV